MLMTMLYPLMLGLALSACGQDSQPPAAPIEGPATAAAAAPSSASIPAEIPASAADDNGAAPAQLGPPPDNALPAPAMAQANRLIRREWARAENRAACAPVTFASTAGATASPRRAAFAGGWAAAFDQPGLRSAFGIAGTGLIPQDEAPPAAQRRRLKDQWPYFSVLPGLPRPSFAGYGIEGARPYSSANPGGKGVNSLAYVRIGGQRCTYNVWSRLGRAHLEALLDGLRVLPQS